MPSRAGHDAVHEDLDAGELERSAAARVERGRDGPTPFVPQHHKQRRAQMGAGVLEGASHFAGDHVARHAYDEQVAEAGIEHQLRGHAGITAAEDGGEGLLAARERGERCRRSRGPSVSVR